MSHEETHELAALRWRAYGPAAQPLSEDEIVRLRELEGQVVSTQEAAHDEHVASADSAADADVRETGNTTDGAASTGADAGDSVPAASRSARSSLAIVALVVVAALVPISGLAGYLLAPKGALEKSAPSVPLLSAGDYESMWEDRRAGVQGMRDWDTPVALLGASGAAAVWWGVEGAQTCVVVEADIGFPFQACDATDVVRAQGLEVAGTRVLIENAEEIIAGSTDLKTTEAALVFVGNPYTGRYLISLER